MKTFPGKRFRWQRLRSDLSCASLPTRREFLRQAGFVAALHAAARSNLTAGNLAPVLLDLKSPVSQLGYSVRDVAREAHLDFLQVCGGDVSKKYILETTGSGVAFID